MILKNIRKFINYNQQLPLDQKITNQVLLILVLVAFLSAAINIITDFPTWFPYLFVVAGLVSFIAVLLNYFKQFYRFTKFVFLIVIYIVAVFAWMYNAGINGSPLLFFLTIVIYSIGVFGGNFLFYFILNFVLYTFLVVISYLYPSTIKFSYRNETDKIIDMICAYFILSSSIVLILRTIIQSYKKEKLASEAQKNQLEMLNKDKDLFIQILSHDLRGPFNSLIGFSDLLLKNYKKYEASKIDKHLSTISLITHNTYSLLDDLLTWSKIQSGKFPFTPQMLKFNELCCQIVQNMQESANTKHISINCSAQSDLTLNADLNMFKTILRNLISNAIKFTNENGKIDISIEKEAKNAIISVSDNGKGIDKIDQSKLWDVSHQFSTKGTGGEAGTGLGLILCKSFVEKHNGKIWVESELNKGSKFKFILPLYEDVS
jgi:signal transduction histidine kinase